MLLFLVVPPTTYLPRTTKPKIYEKTRFTSSLKVWLAFAKELELAD